MEAWEQHQDGMICTTGTVEYFCLAGEMVVYSPHLDEYCGISEIAADILRFVTAAPTAVSMRDLLQHLARGATLDNQQYAMIREGLDALIELRVLHLV